MSSLWLPRAEEQTDREALFISEKTVGHYMTSIFDKLGVTDRLELLIYAYQHKLAEIVPPSRAAGQRTLSFSPPGDEEIADGPVTRLSFHFLVPKFSQKTGIFTYPDRVELPMRTSSDICMMPHAPW